MIRALRLRWAIRNARADIRMGQAALRHAQNDCERLPAQIRAWEHDEAALQVELALLPRWHWPSIAFASLLGAALAITIIYGPT